MERDAVSALYAQYGYAVHRRCLRLLGSEAEADDALQAVFMRVMRYGDTLRGEAPLPWLYRIADRHCFDVLKKKKREVPEEVAVRRGLEATQDGAAPERMSEVRRVLGHCAGPVQEIAVLYYVDEMTQDEVAATVGASRKTVRLRLAEFMATARRVLELREPQGGES
jgi:RNA polymerase sigma factor (sigma-70 family)